MAILNQDIKLLKSVVMADTADGGGQMAGTAIVDGASNNLFPDTSAMDRAFGRVNMRKVFGVAQTTDTDTLMGAHAIITDAPDDPLVHCNLMKASSWADNRTTARGVIESYLVKGNRHSCRIYDTHYAGSLQLRLYSFVGAPFPSGGDAVVIRNPNGAEQYVRVLRTTQSVQNIAVVENNNTLVLPATLCVCELGQALQFDVLGPPALRVGITETNYAYLYTTVVASGAKFYGIKPLGTAGNSGDLSVTTSGGMYSPLVPAATIETPIIDKHPLQVRQITQNTSVASLVTPAVSVTINAGSTLVAPTAITPKSLTVAHGATTFSDTGYGDGLYQGTTKVADVDYTLGVITFLSTSPSYGTASNTITYSPSTPVGATAYSVALDVTLANQGLAYTNSFSPAPGPGSFTLSYMAQGRWYSLSDNKVGKLVGADASYGVGTISYATGSMAVTLGAIPDVGSPLLAQWGDAASASIIGNRPAKAGLQIPVRQDAKLGSFSIAWSNGATNYTATTDSAGVVVSANATGAVENGILKLYPNVMPSGDVTVNYLQGPALHTGGAVLGPTTLGTATDIYLTDLPVSPGSIRGTLTITPITNVAGAPPGSVEFWDADGWLVIGDPSVPANTAHIGSINYTTGRIQCAPTQYRSFFTPTAYTGGGWIGANQLWWNTPTNIGFYVSDVSVNSWGAGTSPDLLQTINYTPTTWYVQLLTFGLDTVLPASIAFTLGGDLYTGDSTGALRKGWNANTGTASVASAGSVSSNGLVTITSLPTSRANAVGWLSAAMDTSSKKITTGIFRTESAPLKTGVMQLHSGSLAGTANDNGDLTGDFTGKADFSRGVVRWVNTSGVDPASLTYNAVFLQYMPLDSSLLGMDTARLPLDGKVPIYRSGDLLVVHNTQTYTMDNPLTKNTVYNIGRTRIASVRVKDSAGTVVPDTKYTVDLNLGTIMVPTASDITAYVQPLKVEHRIEDMVLCSAADISGKLSFTRSLTHNFPANTSYVSSAMPFGDLFARYYAMFAQATWTSVWQDTLIGSAIIPQYNAAVYPVVVTNQGAIRERWVLIFTGTTAFRVIGESVGEIAAGSVTVDCAPINPATGVPYFTLKALGWGSGWSTGNCLRFNTDACGTPFWAVRTVLQGPASIDSDQFTLAFRGDVDRP